MGGKFLGTPDTAQGTMSKGPASLAIESFSEHPCTIGLL